MMHQISKLFIATGLVMVLAGPQSLLALQQGNGSAPTGRRVVPALTMASRCVTMVSPYYPPQLRTQGSQIVVLQAVIRSDGAVNPIRLISGSSMLGNQAMDAVRLWKYRPYMEDGVPVDVVTDIKVPFVPGNAAGMISHPSHR